MPSRPVPEGNVVADASSRVGLGRIVVEQKSFVIGGDSAQPCDQLPTACHVSRVMKYPHI